MSTVAFIGAGANLGDRAANIQAALSRLNPTRVSTLMGNAAIGGPPDSPPFLNAVAEIQTTLSPKQLLDHLLAIETDLGRVRNQRWEPRLIDLDLLLYGEQVINQPGLTIPHPRMHQRRFVLAPLAEIAPNYLHPVLNKTIRQLLDELPLEP